MWGGGCGKKENTAAWTRSNPRDLKRQEGNGPSRREKKKIGELPGEKKRKEAGVGLGTKDRENRAKKTTWERKRGTFKGKKGLGL